MTGEMRSFMERLLFQYHVYTNPRQTLFPQKIRTAFVYTMNAPEEIAKQIGYERFFKGNEQVMNMILGPCESLMSYDTYQFEDYSKVVADGIDEAKKRTRRETVFPQDARKPTTWVPGWLPYRIPVWWIKRAPRHRSYGDEPPCDGYGLNHEQDKRLFRFAGLCRKGTVAGDVLSQNQRMNIMGAFIGINGFQIQ